MAVFNLASVGNLDNANDLKQVKDYLYKLQEQLKYMFNNLDPDDNYSASVPKLTVVTGEDGEAHVEVTQGGVVISAQSGVTEDNLISTINSQLEVSGTGITISTNGKFSISTPTFTLDQNGNMNVNNNFIVSSNGTVTAKNIVIGQSGSGRVGYFSDLKADSLHTPKIKDISDAVEFRNEDDDDYIDIYCLHCYGTSDRRQKENIVEISESDAVNIMKDLEPVTFNFIGKTSVNAGFIAQDVENVLNENESDIKLFSIGKDGYYSLDYPMFVPIIVKAVQYLLRRDDERDTD